MRNLQISDLNLTLTTIKPDRNPKSYHNPNLNLILILAKLQSETCKLHNSTKCAQLVDSFSRLTVSCLNVPCLGVT